VGERLDDRAQVRGVVAEAPVLAVHRHLRCDELAQPREVVGVAARVVAPVERLEIRSLRHGRRRSPAQREVTTSVYFAPGEAGTVTSRPRFVSRSSALTRRPSRRTSRTRAPAGSVAPIRKRTGAWAKTVVV